MTPTCSTISPPVVARISNGSENNDLRSRLEPIEKKKTPSRSDLIGSMVVCTARRYSVSASNNPATKAPSAIEKPRCRRHEAGADRDEQCRCDEEVVVTRLCDEAEQTAEAESVQRRR